MQQRRREKNKYVKVMTQYMNHCVDTEERSLVQQRRRYKKKGKRNDNLCESLSSDTTNSVEESESVINSLF